MTYKIEVIRKGKNKTNNYALSRSALAKIASKAYCIAENLPLRDLTTPVFVTRLFFARRLCRNLVHDLTQGILS